MSDTDDAVAGESSGAQVDELDSLLSDFDQPDQTGTEPPKVTKTDLHEVVSYVREDREAKEMQRTNADIDTACKTVYDGLAEGTNLPERAVRGLLIDMAETDPRFRKAFIGRASDPAGWNKILQAKAKELSTEFTPKVDGDLSADKEAIASAVRSASTRTPEPPQDDAQRRQQVQGMTDQELRMEVRKLGG